MRVRLRKLAKLKISRFAQAVLPWILAASSAESASGSISVTYLQSQAALNGGRTETDNSLRMAPLTGQGFSLVWNEYIVDHSFTPPAEERAGFSLGIHRFSGDYYFNNKVFKEPAIYNLSLGLDALWRLPWGLRCLTAFSVSYLTNVPNTSHLTEEDRLIDLDFGFATGVYFGTPYEEDLYISIGPHLFGHGLSGSMLLYSYGFSLTVGVPDFPGYHLSTLHDE